MKTINPADYQNNLVVNPTNIGETFSKNLLICKKASGLTWNEISQATGLSHDTLKAISMGKNSNYTIESLHQLAKLFKISMEELCGSDAISLSTLKSLKTVRSKNTAFREFLWNIIDWIETKTIDANARTKYIPVYAPVCETGNGSLKYSLMHIGDPLDISDLEEPHKSKVIMAVKIPCSHYIPKYYPGDYLLIANDRNPERNETVVIVMGGYIWFAYVKKGIINGKADIGMYSIIDNHFCGLLSDADQVLGYVTLTHHSIDNL